MVATRRTAPTGADTEMPDPELALKKKPVRKATAKKTASMDTTTKAKPTRSRKAEPAPIEKEKEVVEEAPRPRATRGRPKKTVEVAVEPELEPEQSTKPTRSTKATKAGSIRGKKAAVPVEEAPQLPAPKETKPARQTRAGASKAPPLSPKKITQVAKPQTRGAKTTGQKANAKPTATKGSVRGRAATRSGKVSDENADVPELPQPEEEDSVVVLSSTPVKKPVTRRAAAKKQEADETDVSMSTRATTPTASPAPSQHTDAESQADEPTADLSTPVKEDTIVDNNDSDDELCGPKTPMRRGSAGAEARYHSSAQRTIRKYNEEQGMQTPARRYAVLGSQRGTPQTQKPLCKPTAPSSEVRPMTVARGANRAFVFRDLRDGAPDLPQQYQPQQDSIAEEEDLSFIPDDNIIPVEEEDEGAQLTTPTTRAPVQLASPPTSSTDIEDEDLAFNQDDDNVATTALDGSLAEDPDATIVTEEGDVSIQPNATFQQPELESFETEDTVIINRPEQAEAEDLTVSSVEDESEKSVIHKEAAASSTPETMVWENVQQREQPIAVDFDEHLNESRTLPEPETTEVLDIAFTLDEHVHEPEADVTEALNIVSTLDEHLQPEQETEAGAEDVEHAEDDLHQQDHNEAGVQTLEDEPPVETPAIDFNDYFDMKALAEPTQVIDFAPQPADSVDVEMPDAGQAQTSEQQDEDATIDPFDIDEPAVHDDDSFAAADDPKAPDVQTFAVDDGFVSESSAIDDRDVDVAVEEAIDESELPHYARSTLSFDARRKSLPVTSMFTPVKADTRPNTSDGMSMPRMENPFSHAWWARSRANSIVATEAVTPRQSRPSTAHGNAAASGFNTPSRTGTPAASERYPVFAPRQDYVDHSQTAAPTRFRDVSEKPATRRQTFHRAISGKTQQPPSPAKPSTPAQKPKERYPVLGSTAVPVDHSQTVAPPSRFQDKTEKATDRRKTFHRAVAGKTQSAPATREPPSPAKVATPAAKSATPVATPKERYPALGNPSGYVDHAKTAAPPARFQSPASKPATRRQTFHRAISGKNAEKEEVEDTPAQSPVIEQVTPVPQQTPVERFPRRRPQAGYEQHAQTVAAPRFATPQKSPIKRPATAQKPVSMRKAALRNNTSTPMKTPLKAPATTPGQEPMTPHPAAPLRGVVALVEVYTLEGASASAPFTALLHRLGAKTTRTWTDKVTHVIFKDGSPTTLQRVRLHNKDVEAAGGKGTHIFCVNSRWVSDCDAAGTREDENDEAYAIDVEEVPRGGKRRRKSMEPSALKNLGGNVVRDRQSSLSRSSLGRSSLRFGESPAKKAKLEADATPGAEDKENSDEEPATPAWIAQPNKLVQQTAPMKRVRKLELEGKPSTRRMTFWEGGD